MIADILDKAADLIEPEGAWTRGGARGTHGGTTWSEDPLAVSFCAHAAISRLAGGWTDPSAFAARRHLQAVIGTDWIGDWNDDSRRTQPEVVAKLREAARLAREQGK